MEDRNKHLEFMKAALEEAKAGYDEGGIPIGCVIVHDNKILSRGRNRRVQFDNTILHAEMDAIQNVERESLSLLPESTLYSTLSPCAMCTGAIILYKIPHVVMGENRNFIGEEELLISKGVTVENLNNRECYDLLHEYIDANANVWNEDIGIFHTTDS